MIHWSPTERTSAVSGAVRLLAQQPWRESEHGPALRDIVADALDAEDRVLRYHAACGVRLLADADVAVLDLIRGRLLTEQDPDVAAVLVGRLAEMVDAESESIDLVLAELLALPLWTARIAATDHDVVESLVPLVALVLRLAITAETPAAVTAVAELLHRPVRRPIAWRGISLVRSWLALPPDRASERRRAFAIVRSAARAIEQQRRIIDDPNEAADLYRTADAIVTQVYFASGAFITVNGAPTSRPVPEGFLDEALPILDTLTAFREPSIVHRVVETLEHLTAGAPKRCFLVLARLVEPGDEYTADPLAADTTIALVGRFVSEYRELLADDRELLSAVHRVLGAFAKVGWPGAMTLASRLGDAFR